MSSDKTVKEAFECAEEATALLNCIADKEYNELKCLPLVKKLRACVKQKVKKKQIPIVFQDGTNRAWSSLSCCQTRQIWVMVWIDEVCGGEVCVRGRGLRCC